MLCFLAVWDMGPATTKKLVGTDVGCMGCSELEIVKQNLEVSSILFAVLDACSFRKVRVGRALRPLVINSLDKSASSNKCIATSKKKLLVTSALLLVLILSEAGDKKEVGHEQPPGRRLRASASHPDAQEIRLDNKSSSLYAVTEQPHAWGRIAWKLSFLHFMANIIRRLSTCRWQREGPPLFCAGRGSAHAETFKTSVISFGTTPGSTQIPTRTGRESQRPICTHRFLVPLPLAKRKSNSFLAERSRKSQLLKANALFAAALVTVRREIAFLICLGLVAVPALKLFPS